MASKCDILIVDDDQANLDTLERLFTKDGYGVHRAQRGNEGLDIARSQGIPIILTDLMMPGEMDGLDLLKGVRAIGLDCDVILMTAYGTVETAVEAMKEGAYDFITKPFKRVQVLKTVERAGEKRKLLNENKKLRDQLQRKLAAFRHHRIGGGDETPFGDSASGGSIESHIADFRRKWNRQGAVRSGSPSPFGARKRPLRGGQLRGSTGIDSRIGTVRLRKRCVHRRGESTGGTLRDGRRRDAVPR